MAARDVVSDQEMNCEFTCSFDQICKQKKIHILNNTKSILNRIVSISAKLIIND